MKATKLKLARIRNFNKLRVSCINANLITMLQHDAIGLTLEEKDSLRYILKITEKLLERWPKTVNPIQ